MLAFLDNNTEVWFIWMPNDCEMPEIVHEILHVVLDIFANRGIKVDHDNDEPFTYYTASLLREIMKFQDRILDK